MTENKPLIIGDSCADWMDSYYKEHDLFRFRFTYLLDGEPKLNNGTEEEADHFYHCIENGSDCSTSQLNVHEYISAFEELIQQGRPIIYICFSSGLSSSHQNAVSAAQQVMEEHPGADITVIDSLAASVGEGLVLDMAVRMAEAGKSKEEIIDWMQENVLKLHLIYTVDELKYLKKGGRCTSAAAFFGDMLNIKPVMTMSRDGRLMAFRKERGRKKVLKAFMEEMEKRVVHPEGQIMSIGYGDCREDAETLRNMILAKYPDVAEVRLSRIGPVIGAHVGPSVLALFYWGIERQDVLNA